MADSVHSGEAPPRGSSPWVFILLVFALSIPFWILSATMGRVPKEILPINLPIAALMAFMPMVAALILVYRQGGGKAARSFLKRIVDLRRVAHARWYLIALLVMPVAMTIEFFVLRFSGVDLPEPVIPIGAAAAFFLMFLAGGIGEELGWQGYVFPLMRERWNALETSLILAVMWALWHVIPLLQAEREPEWIFWQALTMLPLRVITIWIFVNAGESVFIAALFHAVGNVAQFLFPNYGSHYDPFVTFVILVGFSAGVIVLWGPATLARFRFAAPGR